MTKRRKLKQGQQQKTQKKINDSVDSSNSDYGNVKKEVMKHASSAQLLAVPTNSVGQLFQHLKKRTNHQEIKVKGMLDLEEQEDESASQSSKEETFVIKEEKLAYKRKHSDVARLSASDRRLRRASVYGNGKQRAIV